MTTAREQDYYTEARQLARSVWNGINGLKALQNEWNSKDYGNTLDIGTGPHEGLTRTEVGAAVFATADAMQTLLGQGHGTNLAKLL